MEERQNAAVSTTGTSDSVLLGEENVRRRVLFSKSVTATGSEWGVLTGSSVSPPSKSFFLFHLMPVDASKYYTAGLQVSIVLAISTSAGSSLSEEFPEPSI